MAGTASGYNWTDIGDVARVPEGRVEPQKSPDAQWNYLSLGHVEPKTGALVGFRPRLGREILSPAKVFRPSNVLYGLLRPSLCKAYLAEGKVSNGICSREFVVLEPDAAKVRPAYLQHALASSVVGAAAKKLQVGSVLPRIRVQDFLRLTIPVPTLPVQDRLVTEIARLEAGRRELEARLVSIREGFANVVASLDAGQS